MKPIFGIKTIVFFLVLEIVCIFAWQIETYKKTSCHEYSNISITDFRTDTQSPTRYFFRYQPYASRWKGGHIRLHLLRMRLQRRHYRHCREARPRHHLLQAIWEAGKQDLTISCNKPSERIQAISDMNNSRNIWDFVEEHLAHLPVVCEKGNTIISVAEWNK